MDGPYVHEGIVQVLESGAWRSVCTNSKNWTAADMGVACKQLGFAGGEWHHWFPHLNDTRQILYQDPGRKSRQFVVTPSINYCGSSLGVEQWEIFHRAILLSLEVDLSIVSSM